MERQLTVSRGLSHLLALAALLRDNWGRLLVVVVLHRSGLALLTTALLGSGGSRGSNTGLAAGVFDLLQSIAGADSHALGGLRAELTSGLVIVDLRRWSASELERREVVYVQCHQGDD